MAETPVSSDESGAQRSCEPLSGAGGGAAYAHPRISGGNGLTLEQAVVVQATGMEMALMLMQLCLEQAHGVKGRDWLPGMERWVDCANHAPRSVRAVEVELGDGAQREYYFDLGCATGFGQEARGAAPMPTSEPSPVPQARDLGLVSVAGAIPIPEPAMEAEAAAIDKPVTGPVAGGLPVSSELNELLNRKELWRDVGVSARQQGVDWGWWLTLAACAAAGAIAVSLWKPASTSHLRSGAQTLQETGESSRR